MSRENLEIARRAMEASNRRDRRAWLELCDPELEFRADPEWPESETVRGRDAAWEFLAGLYDAWDAGDFELGEVVDAGGDRLLIRFTGPVLGKSSGIADVLDYWCAITFRGGTMRVMHWYATRDKALRALGGGLTP